MGTSRLDLLDRNFIINGGLDFWQRALSKTNITASQFIPDRFYTYSDAGAVGTIQRSTDVPSGIPLLKYSAEYALTTTPQDGSNRNHRFIHRIESIFSRMIAGKAVSLSFWVKTVDFTHLDIELATPTSSDTWSGKNVLLLNEIAIDDSGIWTQVKLENVVLPASVKDGLQIIVWTKNRSSAGVTNFKITGMKLNIGTKAQEFSLAGRDYVEELQLCQRYFEKTYDLDTAVGTITGLERQMVLLAATSTNAYNASRTFAGRKRVVPTVVFYNFNTGTANTIGTSGGTNVTIVGIAENSRHSIGHPVASGSITDQNAYYYHWTADAEL